MRTAIVALTAFAFASCGGQGPTTTAATVTKKAVLEMYVMSQCPYGVQVVNAIAPVKKQLGDSLELKIGFIGDGQAGALTSMHGPTEVKGDVAQLCAMKQAPDKYLDLMVCQNQNPKAVDTNWKDCASQSGMDVAALTTCVDGDEGQQLAAAAFADAKTRGATGSPTMFLDGKPYEGGRKTKDFLKNVCDSLGAEAPQPCKEIPPSPVVNATFFSDTRCAKCDISKLEGRLKSEFSGLVVQHVDYSSDEGKKLYAELKAADPSFKFLPAVLFAAGVEKDTEGIQAVQRFLKPVGTYQSLALGGDFDPTSEICDNTIDDDANGQSDCADSHCAEQLVCRTAIPNKLDMFVMSQCPYGAKAMIAAQDVANHFGSNIDIDVHFIGDVQGATLGSMHGPAEVDEDIREICAYDKYQKNHQFLKYLACRSKDYKSADWQPCAKEAGMDTGVIQSCFDGEGKDLLRKSFELSASLGIGASPTWLANNKRQFSGIAAPDIQKQFCQDNPSTKGCDGVVATDAAAAGAPVPAGACGE